MVPILTSTTATKKLSGLQKQIRSIYKSSLKIIKSKPIVSVGFLFRFLSILRLLDRSNQICNASLVKSLTDQLFTTQASRPNWYRFILYQFHQTSPDFNTIEYRIRRGVNQLERYESPSILEIKCPNHIPHYPLGWIAKGGRNQSSHHS